MFSDLKKFTQKSFWEDHKTFTFDTLYKRQTYEAVTVFKTVVYTNTYSEFRYYQFSDAKRPEEFDAYITACKERALYDTGVTAEYGDKLITLSTCEYSNKNGRLSWSPKEWLTDDRPGCTKVCNRVSFFR